MNTNKRSLKRITLPVVLFAFTLFANAQVLKNGFLKEYKFGDKLEKAVYNDKKEPIRADSWNGAFSANPLEGAESPLIGKALSYKDYVEGGTSIDMSSFPISIKGSRFSVYSLTNINKEYRKGAYYLAFLVNFSKLGGRNFADFIALDVNYMGGANRGKVFVAREGKDKIKFGVSVRNTCTEGTETYDYNKTHLLVLKVDYDNNQASLFIDPELSKKEPKASLVANGEEGDLKNGLKSISFRYRNGYKGEVGNFRFASDWVSAIGK